MTVKTEDPSTPTASEDPTATESQPVVETPSADPASPTPPEEQPANSETPPWGDDANFDAATAWKLIENLRTDKAKLQEKVAKASIPEAPQPAASAEGPGEDLQAQLEAAKRDLYIERARHAHNVPEDLLEFLTGTTEEAILAQAAKLASVQAPSQESIPVTPAPTKPKPDLVPGHGGDAPVEIDYEAIARNSRR